MTEGGYISPFSSPCVLAANFMIISAWMLQSLLIVNKSKWSLCMLSPKIKKNDTWVDTQKKAFSSCLRFPLRTVNCTMSKQNWKSSAFFHKPTCYKLYHHPKPELKTQIGMAVCQPFRKEEVYQREEEFWLNGITQVKEQSPTG